MEDLTVPHLLQILRTALNQNSAFNELGVDNSVLNYSCLASIRSRTDPSALWESIQTKRAQASLECVAIGSD